MEKDLRPGPGDWGGAVHRAPHSVLLHVWALLLALLRPGPFHAHPPLRRLPGGVSTGRRRKKKRSRHERHLLAWTPPHDLIKTPECSVIIIPYRNSRIKFVERHVSAPKDELAPRSLTRNI